MKFAVMVFLMVGGLIAQALADDAPDRASWSKTGGGQTVNLSRLVDLDGHSFDPAADGAESIVVVHFWATWCEPCLEEFPRLDRVAQQFAARHVTFVAVSEDRGGAEDVRAYMDKHGWFSNMKVLIDPGRKTARSLGVSVLPSTIVINNQAEVDRVTGSCLWDSNDLARLGDDIGN